MNRNRKIVEEDGWSKRYLETVYLRFCRATPDHISSATETDKLHEIVRAWKPGKYTKNFLCHLVELIHSSLKALEWFKSDRARYIGGVNVSATDGNIKNGKVDKAVLDRVAAAKKFDFERYFSRLARNE